jgi:RimJ/RimL family protein N-acetyltransferase
VTIHFYRRDPGDPMMAEGLPPTTDLRLWTPEDGVTHLRHLPWWLLHRLGGFARPGFAALEIERNGQVLHRLIVTPRWYRFPFMVPADLQIGGLWTHPAARRLGLARMAIAEVQRQFGDPGTRFWYITDSRNIASVRTAEAAGFRLIGTGRRTRPFGLRLLGQYRLTG